MATSSSAVTDAIAGPSASESNVDVDRLAAAAAAAAAQTAERSSSPAAVTKAAGAASPAAAAATAAEGGRREGRRESDNGTAAAATATAAADNNNDDDEPAACRICMAADMSDPTAVDGCGHTFCYVCVHQWGSTRRAPTCPVCRGPLAALRLSDGSVQAVTPAAAAAGAGDAPDLSCLDHAYMLAEVARLASRAEAARARVYRDAMNCGRGRGGAGAGADGAALAVAGLGEVLARLAAYRGSLSGAHAPPFDAEALLHDLYRLDRMVTSLATGSSEGLEDLYEHHQNGGSGTTAAERRRGQGAWHEDDYDDHDYEDDDDDDYHDDDYCCDDGEFDARALGRAASGLRSVSWTPGRRPPNRNGSGGGRRSAR